MEKAINKYLDYLKYVKHYSDKTIESYGYDLNKFNKFLVNASLDFKTIIDKDVTEYITFLKINGYEVSSINRKIVTLRNFYKYYVNNIDFNIVNPMINFETLKEKRKLPKDLFLNQVKILLTPNEKKQNLQIRNQCIISLLFYCGLRVGECVNLDLLDLDLTECCIRVFGKGSKERSVFFKPSISSLLEKYLKEVRPYMLENETEQALFVSSKGSRITSRAIQLILNDRVSQSSVPFKVTPHMLRHTFATNLLNNDVDLKILQELLGHSSLSTTQIYTHVSKARQKKVYETTHPMAQRLNLIKGK